MNGIHEAGGSIPPSSTSKANNIVGFFCIYFIH